VSLLDEVTTEKVEEPKSAGMLAIVVGLGGE
jgi:hypothetical protein